MRKTINALMAACVTGSLLLAAVEPTMALPLASNGSGVQQAVPDTTTNVRWHGRWGRGRGWGWGVGVGALGLGIAAASVYGPRYYYGPGYYYGPNCWYDRWGRRWCNGY